MSEWLQGNGNPWIDRGPSWAFVKQLQRQHAQEIRQLQAINTQRATDKRQILEEHLTERADSAGMAAKLGLLREAFKKIAPAQMAVLERDLEAVATVATEREYMAQEARAKELFAWLNR